MVNFNYHSLKQARHIFLATNKIKLKKKKNEKRKTEMAVYAVR